MTGQQVEESASTSGGPHGGLPEALAGAAS